MKTLWVSWSGLKAHETCKQQGMLRRSRKQAPLKDQRVFFPGTVVDRVVRDWLIEDPYNNPGLMPDMVESIVHRESVSINEAGGKMVWKDKDDRSNVIKDCIEAVTKIEPELVRRVLPFEYDVDFRFRVPVQFPYPDGTNETVILNGAMDIITRDDTGQFSVWDVKMTRDNSYWRKTVAQLTFYDIVVSFMGDGRPSKEVGLLQPMCTQPVLPYPATDYERGQMFSRIARYADQVWREDFEPRKDSFECNFCDVKHACSKFKPVNTAGGLRKVSFGSKG